MSSACAAAMAASTSVRCSRSVTSWIVPPVCRLAVLRTGSTCPSGSTSSMRKAVRRDAALGFAHPSGSCSRPRSPPPAAGSAPRSARAPYARRSPIDLGRPADRARPRRGSRSRRCAGRRPRRTAPAAPFRHGCAASATALATSSGVRHIDRDALALLAPRRLDHDAAMLRQERGVLLRASPATVCAGTFTPGLDASAAA